MNTSTFQTASVGTPPPDPAKHVKYTQGMVLGVDDFTQEFAYLSNRDQWLARDAIGYGTVSGLHVELTGRDGDIEVSVSPGVAINPRGQLIRVTPRQCAKIGAWLALDSTKKQLTDLRIGAGSGLTAYVVLCYRDCPTDELPVPGEPCRCDSETMAASRIMDDFRLELTLTPPPQLEENAVRDFALWLRGIAVDDFTPGPGELEAFLADIRAATGGITSPPQSPPDFFYGSPPSGLRIPRADFCEWMRAAIRLWVTELRPLWQAQCAPRSVCGCAGPCGCHGTGGELPDAACECLLLAEVNIARGVSLTATLDETRRPVLAHLRLLQELLNCGPCGCGEIFSSPLSGGGAEPDDTALVAEDDFAAPHPPDPGFSNAFARADHTHGLPPDPIPPHIASTSDHLIHQIAGDVTGTLGASVVARLQSTPVSNTPPNPGEILQFDGATSRWIPAPAPTGGVTGNFVEHPNVGPYFIVAAGILSRDGTRVDPSYNRLRVTVPPTATNATVTLDFTGYRRDQALIIKGTSLRGRPAIFHVVDLIDRGFVIQFPLSETGGFMLEVSRFNP